MDNLRLHTYHELAGFGMVGLVIVILCASLAIHAVAVAESDDSAGFAMEQFVPRRTVKVTKLQQLLIAVNDIQPGDLIEVADGDYANAEPIRICAGGTAKLPVVIRAKNRSRARMVGSAGFEPKSTRSSDGGRLKWQPTRARPW